MSTYRSARENSPKDRGVLGAAIAVLAMSGADPAIAQVYRGDRACEYYFNSAKLQSKIASSVIEYQTAQVGCVSGLLAGTINDQAIWPLNQPAPGVPFKILSVERIAPENVPAGSCDKLPKDDQMGQFQISANNKRVTFSTSCNHDLTHDTYPYNHACAKCMEIRIKFKIGN
jgi:hypothetical protein